MTDTINALLSSLGLVAQIAIGVLVVAAIAWWVSPGARAALAGPRETLRRSGVWLAWAVAAVATSGSLWFQYGADFIPCALCWYQRVFMYPLAIVLLVAAVTRDRRAFWYGIAFPVIGLAFSTWHVYIEYNPDAETASCKIGASCAVKWIDAFGYITIPVLAGTAFTLIALLLLLSRPARDRGGAAPGAREETGVGAAS